MGSIRNIEKITDKIIHCTHSPCDEAGGMSNFIAGYEYDYEGKSLVKETHVIFKPKDVTRFVVEGEPIIKKKKTANGEVSYIDNGSEVFYRKAFSVEIEFEIGEVELLMGLGQYEDGNLDYRNKMEYLYESNMRIAIPLLMTTGKYAIYIDSESNMIFSNEKNRVIFNIDTADSLSYYIIMGDSIDEILAGYHQITGRPSMLPRWVFGYIQSKERYNDSSELTETVKRFRKEGIPIDCIVQDWYTWDEGLWGEKIFDKSRYPDMKKTLQEIHDDNAKLMVSIWPNMSPDSLNYAEFRKNGMLMDNSNLYDAFSPKARELYFDQTSREIMESDCDALWCDNAEPFSDADWNGQKKRDEFSRYKLVVDSSKQSMPWEKLNAYGLYHAKGIYENWRKRYPKKRVVNLTRSGYAGCQSFGTILWSGDISANWTTLKRQITEGLKMGLSGMPYWTLDIGGFFVVKDKYENRGCNNTSFEPLWFWNGDYNEGVKDLGYQELYTRWLQFGTFLPVFRSHGTDTPREPWNFEQPFRDVITSFIRLRYRLLPYIYSLAAMAHFDSYTMMRSFTFDFAEDDTACGIEDEYMFGPALLIAPVTEAMYYLSDNRPINAKRVKQVYLPAGCNWYDFWDNGIHAGGQYIEVPVTIDRIPIFVKAGSIIPTSKELQYADENNGDIEELLVYPGADGEFILYNDEGNGYGFENGEYSRIRLAYDDSLQKLSVGEGNGRYIKEINNITYVIEKAKLS